MTMINIERAAELLDRGERAVSASNNARSDLAKAQDALRDHKGDGATRTALEATVARRRTAAEAAGRRANAWGPYCESLRAVAKQHGVTL